MERATATSCPRCGRHAPDAAPACAGCGYVLFEEHRAGPRLPRPGPRVLVGVAALGAAAASVVAILAREPEPEPLRPVAASEAETRLERRLRAFTDASTVTCVGAVRRGRLTRCQVGYADGDVQLMLVQLASDGRLDIENPYPAQRRPG